MAKQSAGVLMYRRRAGQVEVFLIHPGGPFWSGRDDGAWAIPKGEFTAGEPAIDAARREFQEETGFRASDDLAPLEPIRQSGGKIVHAWAMEGDGDPASIKSNTFTMEWPPRSGRMQTFPEVDRAAWFTLEQARTKMLKSQLPFLDQLRQRLGV